MNAPQPAPHEAHWPRRLPRRLEVPDTTLWFNAEVSARRFPHKAFYRYLGRELSFAEFGSPGSGDRRLVAAARGEAR